MFILKVLFWMFSGFDQHITSEHLLSSILKQLCEDGHSVHIIQKDTGGSLKSIPENLLNYSITTDVIPYGKIKKENLISRYVKELKYIYDCRRFINGEYDAVFIQSNNVAGFALKIVKSILPKAIITFNVQDIFPYNAVFAGCIKKNSIIFRLLAMVQRYGYKKADHIITISEDMKDTLIEDGVDSEKISIVYNWSYEDKVYNKRDFNMFDQKYYNIVYAGNIGVMQNVDILIDTAKLMKDNREYWFHIIGNGVYKDKLISKAAKYGINNITFWPMQPPELALSIYSSADVNVIPLVKDVYRTALPSKTATCFACQKAIIFAIGKDSKFGKRVTEETSCFVIDSNSAEELANSILLVNKRKPDSTIGEFYVRHCRRIENSKKYVKIITDRESIV